MISIAAISGFLARLSNILSNTTGPPNNNIPNPKPNIPIPQDKPKITPTYILINKPNKPKTITGVLIAPLCSTKLVSPFTPISSAPLGASSLDSCIEYNFSFWKTGNSL